MKLLGFFLLLAGCFLVFASVILLGSRNMLPAFAAAGVVIEIAGFSMVARSFAHSAQKY